MAKNDFKAFATDRNANVMSQEEWEALPALLSGFTAGKASSAQVNKAIRQASFIAAALAQYTANKSGLDVLDDGDLNGFITKMSSAFGKDYQALDATLTALAGLATGANKLPYFTGNDTAAQTDLTSVGRDIIGKNTIADILTYLGLREVFSGLVGDTRNARMIVTAASATATFTADYVIVEDSDGRQYRVKSFSANINLASTGAGGMDTGTAPASGFVALYAIYNPTNGNKAMLAVNATSAALPEIYGGSNMPSGYTASALLCVVPTDSAGKLVPLLQAGRKTLIETAQLSSTTVFIPTPTALNVSTAVPKNAKSLDGILYLVSGNSTRPVISVQPLSSPTVGVKQLVGGNSTGVNNSQAPFSDLAISTPQTIYWRVSEGIPGDTISTAFVYATAYSI